MFINKAILIGNLTRDPELKAIPSGSKVCTFSIATNETYKDSHGVKQEKVEFHNVVVWGKTAENVAQYMKKGSQVYVEGKLQTRAWDDKDSGKKMYRTEILAIIVQFGSNKNPSSNGAGGNTGSAKVESQDQNNQEEIDTIEYPEEQINNEDIPF